MFNGEKDAAISEMLMRYTSAIEAPQSALSTARLSLWNIRQRRRNTRVRVFASAAAVVALVFGVFLLGRLLPPSNSAGTYAAASLKRSNSDIFKAESLEGLLTVKNAGEVADVKEFADKKSGEVYVVAIEYLFLGEGGTERLLVVADFKGGLVDYAEFKYYAGDALKQKTEYENGEYYTFGYFESNGIQYYVILMSPIPTDLSAYIELMS